MPKQFSEQERRKIDARLLSVARDLLAHRSARKIVVEELTRAAGISKGSFYLFYPTKETLFYEVMRLEERTVQGPLIAALESLDPPTPDAVAGILVRGLAMVDENPVFHRMLDPDEIERIGRNVPADYHDRHRSNDTGALAPVLTRWQADGHLRGDPVEHLVGVIRAMYVLALHRRELGEDQFDATRETLVRTVVDGMFHGGHR